jgi:hypothetical protein
MTALAEVRTYSQLIEALRQRSAAIGMTREQLDAEAPLQLGYAAKLLSPTPVRALGVQTMGPVLMTLGVKLVLMEDVEALERITKCAKSAADANHTMPTTRKRKRHRFPKGPEFAKMMRARGLVKQSPVERRKIARAAARARWRRPRVTEATSDRPAGR